MITHAVQLAVITGNLIDIDTHVVGRTPTSRRHFRAPQVGAAAKPSRAARVSPRRR